MEPKNQRYNPKQEQEKRDARIQELQEKLSNYKELEEEVRTARQKRTEIAEAKARMTDVKKAQKLDVDGDWPADANFKLGSSHFMRMCSQCHGLDYDSRGRLNRGPPLGLIYGRLAGSDMHYKTYSLQILASRQLWTGHSMKKFLQAPQEVVPGTLCGLEPIKEEAVAVDLVQFLKELTLANYSFIRSMKVKPPIAEDYQFSRERAEYLRR